ncbi:MAG TPA: T9SS type A sorting domain-containing protein [Phaeodactylibacter sp.]|nr:T9SS type A sorting domain-containing protein [Phaeodactylibacter sp.]
MKRTLLLTAFFVSFLSLAWSQTASSNTLYAAPSYQQPTIKVYPNPASDYIKLSKATNVDRIKILSLIGTPIKTFKVYVKNEKYNVSTLPKGLYLIQLLDSNNNIIGTERLQKR